MKKTQLVGWTISVLLFGVLTLGSARAKLTDWDGKAEMFGKLGFSIETIRAIGFVEIAIAVAFLIPQTGFLGAVLLTAYLGGATAAHVRVGDPFVVPVAFGVITWVALGLRDRRIFQLAFGQTPRSGDSLKIDG